jgi:hypothetical protein
VTVEQFLARVYVDAEIRRRFLADPVEEAVRAGMDPSDAARFATVDREGIELAAASFARKRAAKRMSRRWWRRLPGLR